MPWQHWQPVISEQKAKNKGICESYLSVGLLKFDPCWLLESAQRTYFGTISEQLKLLFVLFSNMFLEISPATCWKSAECHNLINMQWDSISDCWRYWAINQLQGEDINCKTRTKSIFKKWKGRPNKLKLHHHFRLRVYRGSVRRYSF